jgi:steroid delta-isomerase-like uncharacterized protein
MSQSNVSIAHRWFEEVWNQGRLSTIDELAFPHATGHGQIEGGAEINIPQFRALVETMLSAFPDFHVAIQDTISEGDRVVVRWTATMTHKGAFAGTPATGRRANVTGITILKVADGKIAEGWDNWDQLSLLTQIGAVPKASFLAA